MYVIFDPVSLIFHKTPDYEEDPAEVELFEKKEDAERECERQNETFNGYLLDPSGTGLVRSRPWRVFALVGVEESGT